MIWKKIKELLYNYAVMIVLGLILIGITFMVVINPMIIADYEFDRVYEDAMNDKPLPGDSSNDFRAGWIAALKHFKVLWNSVENATVAVIE